MTLTEKTKYAEAKPIGVLGLNNWGGLAVLDVIYGIDDYVVACFDYGDKRSNIGRHKIEETANGRSFFRKCGRRYYFDQIMRV